MTTDVLPQWWEVKTGINTARASRSFKRTAKKHELGCGPKNGWISARYGRSVTDTEVALCKDSIIANYGLMDLDVQKQDAVRKGRVVVWMPRTFAQCHVVLQDMLVSRRRNLDPELMQAALQSSLLSEDSVAIVANAVDSRRAAGVIAFMRELALDDETAVLNVSIKTFECDGSALERGALLASFYSFLRNDIETSYAALARANLQRKFDVMIHGRDDADETYGVFVELAGLAVQDAFNLDGREIDYPEWLYKAEYIQNTTKDYSKEPAVPSPALSV